MLKRSFQKKFIPQPKVLGSGRIASSAGSNDGIFPMLQSHVSCLLQHFQSNMGFWNFLPTSAGPLLLLLWAIRGKHLIPKWGTPGPIAWKKKVMHLQKIVSIVVVIHLSLSLSLAQVLILSASIGPMSSIAYHFPTFLSSPSVRYCWPIFPFWDIPLCLSLLCFEAKE